MPDDGELQTRYPAFAHFVLHESGDLALRAAGQLPVGGRGSGGQGGRRKGGAKRQDEQGRRETCMQDDSLCWTERTCSITYLFTNVNGNIAR